MEQQTLIKIVMIIGGSIVLAALLHGGIYIESKGSAGNRSVPCTINKFIGTKDCSM
jgi:hypothetical protein